jgi:hypothetical protein
MTKLDQFLQELSHTLLMSGAVTDVEVQPPLELTKGRILYHMVLELMSKGKEKLTRYLIFEFSRREPERVRMYGSGHAYDLQEDRSLLMEDINRYLSEVSINNVS